MTDKPIQAGDSCIVIDGVYGKSSPNIGKTVKVVSLQGQHSKLGNIWRCEGQGLTRFDDSPGIDWADFAQSWLKKADPVAPSGLNTSRELETA